MPKSDPSAMRAARAALMRYARWLASDAEAMRRAGVTQDALLAAADEIEAAESAAPVVAPVPTPEPEPAPAPAPPPEPEPVVPPEPPPEPAPAERPGPRIVEFVGHGSGSRFGRDGRTITVTHRGDSGPGSFRDAVMQQKGPRNIVFAVGGTIPVPSTIGVRDGSLSILGATAPSPGINLQGTEKNHDCTLKIGAADVAIDNVGLYQSRGRGGKDSDNRDTLRISGGSRRVVASQCTIMWGSDETLSVWTTRNDIADVTIQYCLIAAGLSETGHPSGEHSKGLVVGKHVERVSIHHCIFSLNARRNPRVQGDLIQLANNVVIANGGERFRAFAIGDDSDGEARFDVLDNRVYGSDGPERGCLVYPDRVFKKGSPRVYARGNIHDGSRRRKSQPEADFFGAYGGAPAANLRLVGKPHLESSLALCTHTDAEDDALRDYLWSVAGARSWDRPEHDRRVLAIRPGSTPLTSAAPRLY